MGLCVCIKCVLCVCVDKVLCCVTCMHMHIYVMCSGTYVHTLMYYILYLFYTHIYTIHTHTCSSSHHTYRSYYASENCAHKHLPDLGFDLIPDLQTSTTKHTSTFQVARLADIFLIISILLTLLFLFGTFLCVPLVFFVCVCCVCMFLLVIYMIVCLFTKHHSIHPIHNLSPSLHTYIHTYPNRKQTRPNIQTIFSNTWIHSIVPCTHYMCDITTNSITRV